MLNPLEEPVQFLKLGREHFVNGDAVKRGAKKIVGTGKIQALVQTLNQVHDLHYKPSPDGVKYGVTTSKDYFSKFWTYSLSDFDSPSVWVDAGIEKDTIRTFCNFLLECEEEHEASRNNVMIEDERRDSMKELERKSKNRSFGSMAR